MSAMDNVTRFPGAVSRTRVEAFKQLWPQGYGRKRMLQFALDNRLFSESELELSKTAEGMEQLYAIVAAEFRDIQDRNVARRREVIVQLLALGLNEREITEQLLDRKLIHNPKFSSAYFNVQKDVQRMVAKMKADDVRLLPHARSLYIRQQTRIMRDAVTSANAAGQKDPNDKESYADRRAQAALLAVAMKASENIAIAYGVDVRGKTIELTDGFDMAEEAGNAIIAKTEEVIALSRARGEVDEYVGAYDDGEDEKGKGPIIDIQAESVS